MNPASIVMLALGALLGAAAAIVLSVGWKSRSTAEPVSSPVTTFVVGLALAGCAYHLIAWALPAHWFPLRVPLSRWWLVPGAAIVAVGGSLLADRLDRR